MTKRYLFQYEMGNPSVGNNGISIVTAGSQGFTVVSCLLNLTGTGSGTLNIYGADSIVGGTSAPSFPLRSGDPSALASAVFNPTSWSSGPGPHGGYWGLVAPATTPSNFAPYPLVVAPGDSLLFQVTGSFAAYLNVFFEE